MEFERKPAKIDCGDDINMDVLASHFGNKFKPTISTINQPIMHEADSPWAR